MEFLEIVGASILRGRSWVWEDDLVVVGMFLQSNFCFLRYRSSLRSDLKGNVVEDCLQDRCFRDLCKHFVWKVFGWGRLFKDIAFFINSITREGWGWEVFHAKI